MIVKYFYFVLNIFFNIYIYMFDNDEQFLIWGKNIFLRNVVMCFNINSIL